jgi:hypothetical protein
MINAALFFLAIASTGPSWYGPEKVNFTLPVTGSPYDERQNDVHVRFVCNTDVEDRLAYYDRDHWSAILVAPNPGVYKASVIRNGSLQTVKLADVNVHTLYTTGFTQLGADGRTFSALGKTVWPIGHDLGWQDPSCPPMATQLATMGQNHMNWSRIWACAFDGRNPWWPETGQKLADRELNTAALGRWDALMLAAERAGVHFQLVLFHHGEFATMVDPNWSGNPWNTANGGFLSDPKLFFTDTEAMARAKSYLRYMVARYASSGAIFSWELFNEVENTDLGRAGDWDTIGKWHHTMADYLRSIDPYHHLITSSSQLDTRVTSALDYYQPHGYPSNISAMLQAAPVLKDKPFFYGEVGLGGNPNSEPAQRNAVRDAIWSSLFSGHSGSAQYWYWDIAAKDNLEPEYNRAYQIIQASGVQPGPTVIPASVGITTNGASALDFTPGLSWAASTKLNFTFPADNTALAMGQLSLFLQGTGHADMGSKVQFNFTAPSAGNLTLALGTVAKSGASLNATIDGKSVLAKTWAPAAQDTPINQNLTAPYTKGAHTVVVQNTGPDWVQIQKYSFSGIGSGASITAAQTSVGVVGRLHKLSDGMVAAQVSKLPVGDGSYHLKLWSLDNTNSDEQLVTVKGGVLGLTLYLGDRDTIFLLSK